MDKSTFFSVFVLAGVILSSVCVYAQPGEGTKLLHSIRTTSDSGFSPISKKILSQLASMPANGNQRLILEGGPGATKQASILWLAKKWNKKAYRIDLSEVISKYIGETEKNLDLIFEDARARDNILFFDNADELFVSRTDVKDSHDRYANQEAAYLLNRIENYQGLVVLSTNNNTKIDSGFLRKFRYIIKTD